MIITNEGNLPAPWVAAATPTHEYTPKRYSVTTILKGPREIMLTRRHDAEITIEAANQLWAIFGTAVHEVLEKAPATETQHKEMFHTMDVPGTDGYKLSGIIDLYDEATKTVIDYKTTSVWKVVKKEYEDYRKQVLFYCVLLRANGHEANAGEVVLMLRDWSPTKAKTEGDYPKLQVFSLHWDFTEEEIAAAAEEISERFARIIECETLPDEELPLCTEKERWCSETTWAVKKNDNVRAVKVFGSEAEAEDAAAALFDKDKGKNRYWVERRPGKSTKCAGYCNAAQFCPFYLEGADDAGE